MARWVLAFMVIGTVRAMPIKGLGASEELVEVVETPRITASRQQMISEIVEETSSSSTSRPPREHLSTGPRNFAEDHHTLPLGQWAQLSEPLGSLPLPAPYAFSPSNVADKGFDVWARLSPRMPPGEDGFSYEPFVQQKAKGKGKLQRLKQSLRKVVSFPSLSSLSLRRGRSGRDSSRGGSHSATGMLSGTSTDSVGSSGARAGRKRSSR